jgi:acetoin utilization protein AcuB
MRIAQWMKPAPHSVKPGDTVRHARALLEEHRINQLPVVVAGKLVGIVTDRDLRDAFPSVLDHRHHRSAQSNPSPDDITVETVMTRKILTVGPEDSVAEAARLMRRGRVGAVPVVEGEKLVGLLTRSDLLDALVALLEERGEGT